MARLALNDDDATVRHWFAKEVEELGCKLAVDEMGNMFARQAGSLGSTKPMTAMGSHLDTQPRGGRYDGILGVMAALEVLRTLKDNNHKTSFDVGAINWTKYVSMIVLVARTHRTDAPQRRRRPFPQVHALVWRVGQLDSPSQRPRPY